MKKLILLLVCFAACGVAAVQNGSQAQLAQIEAECFAAEQAVSEAGAAELGAVKASCAKKLDAWEDAGAH